MNKLSCTKRLCIMLADKYIYSPKGTCVYTLLFLILNFQLTKENIESNIESPYIWKSAKCLLLYPMGWKWSWPEGLASNTCISALYLEY